MVGNVTFRPRLLSRGQRWLGATRLLTGLPPLLEEQRTTAHLNQRGCCVEGDHMTRRACVDGGGDQSSGQVSDQNQNLNRLMDRGGGCGVKPEED